jgi:PhoPQ-activated pathogenicity-related protein
MYDEELVDLIAESIFRNLRDAKIIIAVGDYAHLSDTQKHIYRSMGSNVAAIVDDYYDAELDDDFDDEDDDCDEDIIDEW